MNGAQFVTQELKKRDVQHVFGFIGSAMLKLVDTMVIEGNIQYIQDFHEQASSFAADAYARLTGKMGVVCVTSGPGAVNCLGGVANAYMDSVPMLVLSGQDYSTNVLKKLNVRQRGFQDLDIVECAKPITKYSTIVENIEQLPREIEKSIYIANSGRKGPVLIDIPIDIQFADIEREFNSPTLSNNDSTFFDSYEVVDEGFDGIDVIADRIRSAKRPVIIAGGGIRLSRATRLLAEFVELSRIPIVCTLNGLDCGVSSYGFSGLYGQTYANKAIYHADLLIVFGARLGQRQVGKQIDKYYHGKDIIHIDIDVNELGRVFENEMKICADVRDVLNGLCQNFRNEQYKIDNEWLENLRLWKEKYYRRTELNRTEKTVDPVEMIRYWNSHLSMNTVFCGDVGQNQMWLAQGMSTGEDVRILNSSGYGSMGYSLPAGIGASIAFPNRQIVSVMGDGGFQMNMQELEYLAIHNPNLKCVVFNNGTLGMMREVQKLYYANHYIGSNHDTFGCPNLRSLAKVYGLKYYLIDSMDTFEMVFEEIIKHQGSSIVDVCVQYDSLCLNRYEEMSIIESF